MALWAVRFSGFGFWGGDCLAVIRVMGTFSSVMVGAEGGACTVDVGTVMVAVVAGMVVGVVAATVGAAIVTTFPPPLDWPNSNCDKTMQNVQLTTS